MTEFTVATSITISVGNREKRIEKIIKAAEIEEIAQEIGVEVGQQILQNGIKEIDQQIARRIPKGWRNVGTEERWVTSSVGELRYKRRIYLDEQRHRRKPVDELLGLEEKGRMSRRVQEMGSYLASEGTYRQAANELSWLLKTPVSHSAVQRMVWQTGKRITAGEEAERLRVFESGEEINGGKVIAPVLYGESDGVWVHLQREKSRSAEVRVAIMSSGRKQIGKDRFRLEKKCCLTAVGVNSEEWQEQILRTAHLKYDLSQTKLLISGGDGNHWVRHSFDRLGVRQEFILDQFHLKKAAQRAFHNRDDSNRVVKILRTRGFGNVRDSLQNRMEQAEGKQKEQMEDFYKYIQNNQDVLLDLEHRDCGSPAFLGAIEGNVDKLVVHRMKSHGCCWRLQGLRAMLALCRHKEELSVHAYQYLPVSITKLPCHRSAKIEEDYSEVVQKSMPIFAGPDQGKLWVRQLHHLTHD
jgi:hypothetical protein